MYNFNIRHNPGMVLHTRSVFYSLHMRQINCVFVHLIAFPPHTGPTEYGNPGVSLHSDVLQFFPWGPPKHPRSSRHRDVKCVVNLFVVVRQVCAEYKSTPKAFQHENIETKLCWWCVYVSGVSVFWCFSVDGSRGNETLILIRSTAQNRCVGKTSTHSIKHAALS